MTINRPCKHCPHGEMGHELAGPCMTRGCACPGWKADSGPVYSAPLFEVERQMPLEAAS